MTKIIITKVAVKQKPDVVSIKDVRKSCPVVIFITLSNELFQVLLRAL